MSRENKKLLKLSITNEFMTIDDCLFENTIELVQKKPLFCAFQEYKELYRNQNTQQEKNEIQKYFEDKLFSNYRDDSGKISIPSNHTHELFNQLQDLKEILGFSLKYY